MKSVTIRDPHTDQILVKVLHRKNGEYEVTRMERDRAENQDVNAGNWDRPMTAP